MGGELSPANVKHASRNRSGLTPRRREPTLRNVDRVIDRWIGASRCVLALALLLATGCDRPDVLSENPDLAALAAEWSEEERSELRRALAVLSPEERGRAVEEILRTERERITVESVFVKVIPSPAGGARGLSILTLRGSPEPLTSAERMRIEALVSDGILEIVQTGRVGGGPLVRVVVVMRAPIDAAVEFPLRRDGPLLLVQTEEGWVTEPSAYDASPRTIRLRPSTSGKRTAVDYDIGIGRSGSEPFRWTHGDRP